MELFAVDAERRGITVELEDGNDIELLADPGEVEIVFNNLVSNAVKYNRDGGDVKVKLSRKGGAVTITVSDTGIGLNAEEAGKLFNEFTRIKNEQTVKILGSGLGLSTVRKIANMYDGEARVDERARRRQHLHGDPARRAAGGAGEAGRAGGRHRRPRGAPTLGARPAAAGATPSSPPRRRPQRSHGLVLGRRYDGFGQGRPRACVTPAPGPLRPPASSRERLQRGSGCPCSKMCDTNNDARDPLHKRRRCVRKCSELRPGSIVDSAE